jgi:putative ABC transport system ATP-binding protein
MNSNLESPATSTRSATTQPVLEVSAVHKAYGKVEVLHGVDLTITAGERVALMGPSGSGKSTLLNCLSGIEPIDAGAIRVGSYALSHASESELERYRRECIGYIFQSFHLLPTLSALENIELPGQLIGMPTAERTERVQTLLDAVGLTHRADHKPDALSGGERQRVAIARAIMHRPQVILADEPTGSLDSTSGDRILDLLESLSRQYSIALLLVTHESSATRICERVVHMKDGCIVNA